MSKRHTFFLTNQLSQISLFWNEAKTLTSNFSIQVARVFANIIQQYQPFIKQKGAIFFGLDFL